ncbi:MAG TPA: HlyD family efflux transporter periplasmic adaptor subunit [Sedimenticola sp.]|nr:HlyD family efflux transporter periplasmic adaptor subunit [Sedimenticola sp.]
MIPNISNGMAAFDIGEDRRPGFTPSWPEGQGSDPELAATIDLAIARRASVVSSQEQGARQSAAPDLVVAYPLLQDRQLVGVIGVRLTARQEQQAAVLQLLRWGTAWLLLLAEKGGDASAPPPTTLFECLAAALQAPDNAAATQAAVTVLARELDCERVTLGEGERRGLKLTALSHSADFDPRSNLIRAIEAAMGEAVDAGDGVQWPPPDDSPAMAWPAHERLASQAGSGAVCTFPLRYRSRVIGAICFERGADAPFDAATTALCGQCARLLGPVIGMRRREERPLPMRLLQDGVAGPLRSLLGPRHLGWKLGLISLLLLLAIARFTHGEYRVTAEASLEGAIQRAIVAPFDGYIAESRHRAGDLVRKGQLLARLDDRDLNLEFQKWSGKREEYSRHFRKALAGLDHSETRIFQAQLGQAKAQLALLREQRERTRLQAPFDGVVISGDLSHALGTPVQRGEVLFEVAPLNAYRVALQVDERDIQDIEPGQAGTLHLTSMPGRGIPFRVDKVASISHTTDGEPAFLVEGEITDPSVLPMLRPGMGGVGKVSVGSRDHLWIWSRRLVGWLQLHLWSWLP